MTIRERVARLILGSQPGVSGPVEKGGNWQVLWAKARESELLSGNLTDPFTQHPVVYGAVSAVSENLSAVPLESFKRSDTKRENLIADSVVVERLAEPNPYMVGNQLFEATIASLMLYGNAVWFPDAAASRSASEPKFPTRIEFWEWPLVTVRRRGTSGPIEMFEYGGTPAFKAPASRVLHFKLQSPNDKYVGIGPLQAAMLDAASDYRASRWNEAYFRNSAVPTGFLTPDSNQIVKEESLERMRDQFENRHMGERKHGRIGVLTAAFKWLDLGTAPKDMDFVNLRYMGQEKILMAFKVPPVVAGVLRDANYNLAIQQWKQFWQAHLPTLLYVVAMVNQRLVKPAGLDEALYPKLEVVRALSEDIAAQAQTAREYFNMGADFDQINRRFDLGFDTTRHKAHKKSWLPYSLADADALSEVDPNEDTAPATTQPPGQQNQPGQDTGGDPQRALRALNRATTPDAVEIARTLVWKSLITRTRTEEQAFDKRTRDHLHSLKREVLRNLDRELARNGVRAVAAASLRLVKEDEPPAAFDVDAVLFDEDAAAKDIKRKTAPLYKAVAKEAADSVAQELSISFDLITQPVLDYIDRKVFQIAGLVDEPVQEALRAALRDGMAEGESPEGIKARIDEVFDVSRARARAIARTEVNGTFSNGRASAMEAAGVDDIQWITARDARVRGNDPDDKADHVRLDGTTAGLGETFDNGLRWPHDENGPAEEVVNCRCVMVAV